MKNLSRKEMKGIAGGIVSPGGTCAGSCDVTLDGVVKSGSCKIAKGGNCYCSSGLGYC